MDRLALYILESSIIALSSKRNQNGPNKSLLFSFWKNNTDDRTQKTSNATKSRRIQAKWTQ